MGVTVNETSRERSVAHTTVRPNSRKNCPTISVMKAMGAKTTTSQRVIAIAARAISFRPFTAAARGSSPRAMWRSMFSRMTMESSTRMPMHSPSAMRETTFSVKCSAHIAKNVPTRDTGMATSTMSDERHRRRKRKSTRDVVMMLSTRFSRVSASDELMNSVASLATVTDGARREGRAERRQLRLHGVCRCYDVGVALLADEDADGGVLVQPHCFRRGTGTRGRLGRSARGARFRPPSGAPGGCSRRRCR